MKNKENERYIKAGVTGAAAALSVLLCYFFLSRLKGVGDVFRSVNAILAPFVYGAVIAYLVTPLCRRLENAFVSSMGEKRRKVAATLAVTLSVLTALIVLMAVILLVIPQLIDGVVGVVSVLPGQIREAVGRLDALLKTNEEWKEWWDKCVGFLGIQVDQWLTTGLPDTAKRIVAETATYVSGLIVIIKNVLMGLIVASYLLARRKQLAAQGRLLLLGMLPTSWARWLEREVRFSDRVFNGFFIGKMLDSLIIGVLCFAGCMLMGFASPVLIACIVGITNMIPFFGPFIGAIPCALLLLVNNPTHCLMFVLFIIFLQQLDGNVIGPRILGNTTGLSGLWVMFAIILFGSLWGISGMIIGVPLMAVVYDIIRQITFLGVRKHGKEELIEQYNNQFHPKS